MRFKLTLSVILALITLALPTPVRHSAAKTTLSVGVYCLYLGRNRDECHADVEGARALTPTNGVRRRWRVALARVLRSSDVLAPQYKLSL